MDMLWVVVSYSSIGVSNSSDGWRLSRSRHWPKLSVLPSIARHHRLDLDNTHLNISPNLTIV
jgi:hypothetical protein